MRSESAAKWKVFKANSTRFILEFEKGSLFYINIKKKLKNIRYTGKLPVTVCLKYVWNDLCDKCRWATLRYHLATNSFSKSPKTAY